MEFTHSMINLSIWYIPNMARLPWRRRDRAVVLSADRYNDISPYYVNTWSVFYAILTCNTSQRCQFSEKWKKTRFSNILG